MRRDCGSKGPGKSFGVLLRRPAVVAASGLAQRCADSGRVQSFRFCGEASGSVGFAPVSAVVLLWLLPSRSALAPNLSLDGAPGPAQRSLCDFQPARSGPLPISVRNSPPAPALCALGGLE